MKELKTITEYQLLKFANEQLQSGKIYRITKRIKLHTKQLYEADITLTGRYVRESQNFYIFDTFKVKKANVIKIVETA